MNLKNWLMVGGVASAALWVSCGWAKESTWTGVVSDDWGDAGNWSNGVPGKYKDSSGAVVGEDNDTAIFTSCTGETTIDLANHVSIGNLIVRGADAPKFTFGTSTSQILLIKTPSDTGSANAHRFLVEDSVVHAPEIVAIARLAENRKANVWVVVENNSADTLVMNDFDTRWNSAEFGGSAYAVCIAFSGCGPIDVKGTYSSNSDYVKRATQLYFGNTAGVTFHKSFAAGPFYTLADGARIVIAKDVVLSPGMWKGGGICLSIDHTGLTFDGEGTIVFNPDTYIFCNGKTFSSTFNCRVGDCAPSSASGKSLASRGFLIYRFGTFVFNGASCAGEGEWWVAGGYAANSSVRTSKLGLIGEDGPFGSVSAIGVGNGLTVTFTGSEDDVTDRKFVFGKISSYSYDECALRVDHAGTGKLTIRSPQEVRTVPSTGVRTIYLKSSGGEGVWESPIDDCEVGVGICKAKIVKEGAGKWVLTGNNTYTGATQIEAGTLELGAGGSIASSAVTIKGNSSLAISAAESKNLASLEVIGDANRIQLAAGSNLIIGSLSRTAGSLAVEAAEGAVLKVSSGLAVGPAPSWLTLNGGTAEIGSDGTVLRLQNAWKSAVSGDWNVPGNWTKDALPDASILTSVSQVGDYTVTVAAPVEIGVYEQKSATLSANASMTFGGPATFGSMARAVFGSDAVASFSDVKLDGGDLKFSDEATVALSGTCSLSGRGSVVLTDRAKLTASASATIAEEGVGGVLSLAVSNAASFFDSVVNNLYIGGTGAGGMTHFDCAATNSFSMGYTLTVGRGNGTAVLAINGSKVSAGNGGFEIGRATTSEIPETGTGIVEVVTGRLSANPQAHGWNSDWDGLAIGNGANAKSVQSRLYGCLDISSGGSVAISMGSIGIGLGRADGILLQRGGALTLTSKNTWSQSMTRYMPFVIGYAGGTGSYILSNGTATVTADAATHNRIFVGGCTADDLNRATAFASKVTPGGRDSAGLLAVRGGSLAAPQSDIIVGADGEGTLELAGAGSLTAGLVTISNRCSGTLAFLPDASTKDSLLKASGLNFADGAKLRIDARSMTRARTYARMAELSEPVSGAAPEVELLLPDDADRTAYEVLYEHNGEYGVWLKGPQLGMMMILR